MTFLHGIEVGFVMGASLVAIALRSRLRVLHFEGLVIPRRKAGSR